MNKPCDPLSDAGDPLARAAALVAEGRIEAALRIYTSLCRRFPKDPRIRHLAGLCLYEQGRLPEALAELKAAVKLEPNGALFKRSLADCLSAMQRTREAIGLYREAACSGLENDPDLLLGLGNALSACGRTAEARDCYLRIIDQDPGNKQALNNLGRLLQTCGQAEAAITFYRRAVSQDPQYPAARFNLATALLLCGNYRDGWREYEWRFACHGSSLYPHRLQAPRWDGRPFGGRLLVHAEQGYGDMLFFARYLPRAAKLAGTLVLEAHQPLLRLLSRMKGVDETVVFNPDQPPAGRYDYQVPIGSLPLVLGKFDPPGTDQLPYLQADSERIRFWSHKFSDNSKLKIGLVWSGSGLDPRRDMRPSLLAPLTRLQDVEFYSLQKGPAAALEHSPSLKARIIPLGALIRDFEDTAAICANLDLLITVDTAVAHLAGAMGCPVWVLLPKAPDWRWQLAGESCSWYPHTTCLRQESEGDWNPVVEKVAERLAGLVSGSQPRTAPRSFKPEVEAERLFARAARQIGSANYHEAVVLLQKVLQLKPDTGQAWYNLGYAWQALGKLEQAQKAYARACRLEPDFPSAHVNRATVLMELGDFDKARQCLQHALRIDPSRADAHYNLGNLFLQRGLYREASDHFRQAGMIDPLHFRAWGNLGRVCHETGQYLEAEKYYKMALAINPEYAEAHLNLAVLLLLQGRFAPGWKHYAWRFRIGDWKKVYPHRLKTPCWDGSALEGRSILVHSEQGIGDCLQFVRYLPLVKQRGGRIVFESRKSLASLLKPLPFIDRLCILDPGASNEEGVDCHIGLAGLPAIFSPTPQTIPAQVPYLFADHAKIDTWKRRLPGSVPRVGIVWGGNATYRQRSLALAELLPALKPFAGITFIGLQKGPAAGQADGNQILASNLGEELEDFSDTAAVVHCLDLVISIDTAVAHLAGAMGKPVWVLLPRFADWRWGTDGRKSPWYPSMRLFRQPEAGNWPAVVSMVKSALECFWSRWAS